MFIVYLLQSTKERHYIGFTSNLQQRLSQHNRKHHGSTYGTASNGKCLQQKSLLKRKIR
ncbi:MAG: GIY-YIG nuclease family protein [Ignavibacteriales bacterium]|nr:GIY-YIG nuclease family protein [Ignavibacteriales bacterium]